ncbi:MAG: hypothetical protein ACTSYB_18120 [Candidatus Helarchaeota archaeon]
MTQLALEKISTGIEKIVGAENYSKAKYILHSYAEDASPFPSNPPEFVVLPQNTNEISQLIQFTNPGWRGKPNYPHFSSHQT